jgi:hypothetical protein
VVSVPANDDWAKFVDWEKDTLLKARADANSATNEMGLSERMGNCYRIPDPCE